MAQGVYKPGQGYWVRVLTAVFTGVLVLAGGAWAWKQGTLIRPPIESWRLTLRSVQAEPAVGQRVEFVGINPLKPITAEGRQVPEVLGHAIVSEVEANRIIVDELEFPEGLNPSQAERVNDAAQTGFGARIVGKQGIPAYEPILVQLALMAGVVLIGGFFIYLFVGLNKRTCEFLIATDGEMKKVNWSSRKEIIGSTWVVVFACFLIAAFLFSIDFIFALIFRALDVLETTRS